MFADGVAHIFWEGVLFQFSCDAELGNGIYDRNLRLVKKIDSFSFFDLMAGDWLPIGFPRLKDFCKVSPTGPEMILCVEDGQEEASLHLCSKGMAHNIPNRIQKFSLMQLTGFWITPKKMRIQPRQISGVTQKESVDLVDLGDLVFTLSLRTFCKNSGLLLLCIELKLSLRDRGGQKTLPIPQQPLALEA